MVTPITTPSAIVVHTETGHVLITTYDQMTRRSKSGVLLETWRARERTTRLSPLEYEALAAAIMRDLGQSPAEEG